MADCNQARSVQPLGDGNDIFGQGMWAVACAVGAVAHPRQVQGDDPVLVGEEGGNEIPPVRVPTKTVNEQQNRFVVCFKVPGQQVQATTVGLNNM
ncbi:hypothetical protein D3C86_1888540 [compost metagenome]